MSQDPQYQEFRSLRWGEQLQDFQVIDQRLLPFESKWISLKTQEDYYHAIQDMIVRGAPLIGVTVAYGYAFHLKSILEDSFQISNQSIAGIIDAMSHAKEYLGESRPTAVNLHWALEVMHQNFETILNEYFTQGQSPEEIQLTSDDKKALIKIVLTEAHTIRDEDVESCRQIGLHGLELIRSIYEKKKSPVKILTHCNAGALACVEWGTATSPIYHAHQVGIPIEVLVDETRPRNQGAHLTAWEMSQAGIPHHLIVDNAGGHLMQHGDVDIVIVGSDRTTRTGDVANKIGTYLKALAAMDNNIPFYAALPSSTIDWKLRDGVQEIPIEERTPAEVQYIQGQDEDGIVAKFRICPQETPAKNPGFDVTPARLVSGIITERGVAKAEEESLTALFPELA